MFADPRITTVAFKGNLQKPGTRGSGVMSKEDLQAFILVFDLIPLRKGEVYQLWLWDMSEGLVTAVATFRDTSDGYAMLRFQPPSTGGATLHFGVTKGPGTGSFIPTTPMLLSGSMPSVDR